MPTGWPAADWPPRAAPWRTAATPARCRPFWPSSACSGQAVGAQPTTPRDLMPPLRASTPMALLPPASSGSSRPNRCQREWVVGVTTAFTWLPLAPGAPQSLPLESHVPLIPFLTMSLRLSVLLPSLREGVTAHLRAWLSSYLLTERGHSGGPSVGTDWPRPRLSIPSPWWGQAGFSGTLAAPHQCGPTAHPTDFGSPPERGPTLAV